MMKSIRTMRLLLLPLVFFVSGCQGLGLAKGKSEPLHFDVGECRRAISTESPEAKLWFNRGLGLAFGFNHEEAIACFERAALADPDCAMVYWGKAWALGTNYNSPTMTEEASREAHLAVEKAMALRAACSPAERGLIEALRTRYEWPAPSDRSQLEHSYAASMRRLRNAHPDDADIAALTAEALMQLRPWELWSPSGEPAPELAEVRAVLEPALERWPNHPALCHFYIHAMEAGPEVQLAVPAAETLEKLTPGLGHLIHMPSHIYTWTGRYADVIRVNIEAVAVDDAFVAERGRENFYTAYRIHNYHFVAYGAMWDGQRELALAYSRRLVDEIPASLLAAEPDLFDVFTATPYHVMVRFGMWNELLEERKPAEELFASKAVWRYGRALALAALGRVEEAIAEREAFLLAKEAVPASRLLFNNQVASILEVADKVLEGEIEYRRENDEKAFTLLREAVRLDELLNYDEPWGWMEPARHALGALLVDRGRYGEAVDVYHANLERYPGNGWALHGLAECLRALGHEREASAAEARFREAWKRADVEIPGSCFCRTQPAL